jgi:peptide chain release factor 1
MFDRLEQLEARYEELGQQLSDPKIVNDQENYRKVSKAHRDLEPTVEKFREYRKLKLAVADAKAMLADADMREMAEMELAELEPSLEAAEADLKIMLLPKDPNDDKNVVLELRAGTGGDEASLFACTCDLPSSIAGRSKCSPKPTPTSAASRTSPRSSKARASTRR